jgi:hypothetical protein
MSLIARPTSPQSSAELRLPGNAGWHTRIHVTLRNAIRASCSFGLRHGESGVCAVVCLLIAFGLQCRNGSFGSGFGSHPDEAGHYVTGLMVYKYVMTSLGTGPMAFAERFYAHYPVVAFGHWPPLFYILQATWGLLFGLTRTSALVLVAVLTSLVSTLLYHAVRTSLGRPYAVLCAVLFPLLPIVQLHTSSVMAEVPLTVFAFATALAFASLIARPTIATAVPVLCDIREGERLGLDGASFPRARPYAVVAVAAEETCVGSDAGCPFMLLPDDMGDHDDDDGRVGAAVL